MVRRDIVVQKLAELADRTARVRAHQKPDAAALAADRDALDLVSFNLMLAVQACADLAAHVIADEGWPAPASLAESFVRLADHGVISRGTAEAFRLAVRFRNVVAHGYAGVDVSAVQAGATSGLEDLDRFAREVSAWLAAQASP
ncbi:MAG: DUF86 domain-containing protein [Deltaproteobacteria bacterium]|nr:DUF86 domain-containing protein [Deltaproteobacteria bacterium]